MQMRQAIKYVFALFTLTILFRTVATLPTEASRYGEVAEISKRATAVKGGIHIDEGGCTGQQLAIMRIAIKDASYIATAGLNAASNFGYVPFSYFFKNDLDTANTVADILRRVIRAEQGKGAPVFATCRDIYKKCSPGRAGYTVQHKQKPLFVPYMVLCPVGLSLKSNPKPCSKDAKAGAISRGWLMVHMMVQIRSIGGPTHPIIETEAETASQVRASLMRGTDTTKLSDAYAHLGSWSFDLGLNERPWHQGGACTERFWLGQFDLRGIDAANLGS
ncbi:MAG: hypothetical protein Q9209_007902 [Squamulea sp. 1 TL-2023]